MSITENYRFNPLDSHEKSSYGGPRADYLFGANYVSNGPARLRANESLESNGVLPRTRLTDSNEEACRVLSSSQCSTTEKLRLLEDLARRGVKTITLKDNHGAD